METLRESFFVFLNLIWMWSLIAFLWMGKFLGGFWAAFYLGFRLGKIDVEDLKKRKPIKFWEL